ncbi:hypothetical protein DYB28_009137 [Aphanomyces astaci]|uniref:Uncharacterized protein n=1 Tax=Aphanomyces astaci TaxID=112090 RepID=A0A3L6UTQ4_APHAT|nr:hypothetical protein DYB35_008034 [Aphanomyces astaci]RLN99923.1 hypothetical protein DYB28_009137 [Aphanomyces astaci]
MKHLRHALDAFQVLFDKQIHMCADTECFKVARMKADLMDMLDSVKNASTSLEGSSCRLQKAITGGKKAVHVNQSTLWHRRNQPSRNGALDSIDTDYHHHQYATTSRTWSSSSLTGSCSSGSLDNTTTTPLTLWDTLFPLPGASTLPKPDVSAVAFYSKTSLGKKDVLVFFRELIHWSLVHNHKTLSFLDRSHNKNHSTRYASILTSAAWDELGSLQVLTKVAQQHGNDSDDLGDVAAATSVSTVYLESFVTSTAFAHLVKTISAKLNFSPSKPPATSSPPKEAMTAAENTLSMAKLLHDLANAECEAKNGFKLSVRSNAVRSKEFSKAFLTASKELLDKETTLY